MRVYEKIRKLREERNWTQEDIANKISLSVNSYAKIERGETRLTLQRLEQFAELFNVDISDLIQTDSSIYCQINRNENHNNTGNIHHTLTTGSPLLLDYEHKIDTMKLMIEHKDEKISFLNQQIEDLRKQIEDLRNYIMKLEIK